MHNIFDIIDEESSLSISDRIDPDCVEDDLYDIAEDNEDVNKWIKDIGIDNAVQIVIKRNNDPQIGAEKMVQLIKDLMKAQGSSEEEIKKCVNELYDQYNVSVEHRKEE